MSTKQLLIVLAVLIALAGLVQAASPALEKRSFPEAATIGADHAPFDTMLQRFTELAKDKGAPYAFDVLRRATMDPGTDIHLLAHEIGHQLYKQQGLDGMGVCTQEFGNGCSHSLVIDALQEQGDGTTTRERIDAACKKTGTLSGYTMCYHGLGHGVFAFYGYTFPKTVEFCDKFGTAQYGNQQAKECIGGAIMELVGGGGHDREQWLAANHAYFGLKDPLAPCNTDAIPKESKPMCYVYMSPHIMSYQNANMERYTDEQLTKGMAACAALPYGEERSSCIGGFGKDFAGIVGKHDLRMKDAGGYSDDMLREVERLCKHAPSEYDVLACESYALSSFFWGGVVDPSTSIRFCSILGENSEKDFCFDNLAASIGHNISDPGTRIARCGQLEPKYRGKCESSPPVYK